MNRAEQRRQQREQRPGEAGLHKEFIALNGKRMAALAWHGFQREGRGMIVVDAQNCVPGKRWEDGESLGAFVPLSHVRKMPESPPKQDALRMIVAYDPTTDFVVNILRTDGGASFYRITCPTTAPSEAYEQLKHSPDFQPQRLN
ncbi:MAG: hypothetical protein HY270_19355 [Deltaproteobacteria bacterium]|nr:hypothetical protein [Deltaproteobacteria bacterium]